MKIYSIFSFLRFIIPWEKWERACVRAYVCLCVHISFFLLFFVFLFKQILLFLFVCSCVSLYEIFFPYPLFFLPPFRCICDKRVENNKRWQLKTFYFVCFIVSLCLCFTYVHNKTTRNVFYCLKKKILLSYIEIWREYKRKCWKIKRYSRRKFFKKNFRFV